MIRVVESCWACMELEAVVTGGADVVVAEFDWVARMGRDEKAALLD